MFSWSFCVELSIFNEKMKPLRNLDVFLIESKAKQKLVRFTFTKKARTHMRM